MLYVPTVKATSLGTALPVSSPWYQQVAVAVTGLIRLICLFIYLFSDGPHPGARVFR